MTAWVGLTGSIGSGKSTAARLFAQHGVPLIDADAVSRALTADGGAALPTIRAAFGEAVFDFSGSLNRAALRQLLAQRKLALATSTASFFGSLGWFSAMRLQDVAIVKTVGQIEVLFMLAISICYFREKLQKQDGLGLALIVIAALLVVWA